MDTHSKSGEYLKRPNRPNQGSQYERKKFRECSNTFLMQASHKNL